MLTFTGIHVAKEFGAPSIRDIAVQSMRLVRFSGAADIFWPIGMHMMLVADLMPQGPWMQVHGLLHDAAEIVVADVPRPMKTAEARVLEDRVQSRIYAALGVPEPSAEIKAAVKKADFRAAIAEGGCGCAGRGFAQTQTGFEWDESAGNTLQRYLNEYAVADALDANGRWPLEYVARLRRALREAQSSISYAPEAETVAAGSYSITAMEEAILEAIENAYRSQEHRPSCHAVKGAVLRVLTQDVPHGR